MPPPKVAESDAVLTLPARWGRIWSSRPSEPVLATPDRSRSWVTGGQIDIDSRTVASNLALRGVSPGDRVAWEAHPSHESIVAALGALRLGAVLVPLSEAQSKIERQTVLDAVEPVVLVAPRSSGPASVRSLGTPPSSLLESSSAVTPVDEVNGDDLAMIVFTSGTTGQPKGAMITHANLAAQVDSLSEAWGWTPGDRLLSALPLFHVHGLVVALLTSISVGASIAIEARFDASAFGDRACELNATMTFCVPTMLHRMAALGTVDPLRSLRLVVSGSAPLAPELFGALDRAGVRVLERYGMTETLLTTSNPLHGERRPGSVGLALPGIALVIPESGAADAELLVAGPTVFAGYWRRPQATAEVLHDGWMRTGDLVRTDADGYIRICGRTKDLIISGGFNVYPTEIEDVLVQSPAIDDAAVTGVPSAEWGEEVVAFVVPSGGEDDAREAAEHQALTLSPYKRPRRYVMIDTVPRNAMGKVQRDLLRP